MKWLTGGGLEPDSSAGRHDQMEDKKRMHMTSRTETLFSFLLKFTLAAFLLAAAFGVFITLLFAAVMGS